VEVLDCNIPQDGETKYRKFLQRTIIQEFDVDPRIADAAHQIRAHYRKIGREVSVPDSVHIATACIKGAHQLFTLDGTGKKPGMISLSGRIADRWDMEICAPRAMMGRLFPFTADVDVAAKKDDVVNVTRSDSAPQQESEKTDSEVVAPEPKK